MSHPKITPELIPNLSPQFRFQWEEAQQCFVLLYPEGMVKLNGSAGEILQQVDGQSSVQTIIDTLEKAFAQSGLGADIMEFLQEAVENGWVQLT